MPFLAKGTATEKVRESSRRGLTASLFTVCANSKCASSWLQVWRSRTAPIIEGGWTCSPRCTRGRIQAMIHREREGQPQTWAIHRHRIPLGLVLLAEGWISREQLRKALDAQKAGATDRIGSWLVEHCGLDEHRVTQALSIQWNCPVFSNHQERSATAATLVPRLFIDTFGFLPIRLSTVGILYIAFEDRIDHSLTLAIERMTGLRVEAGLVSGSEFRICHDSMLSAQFPRARLIEAATTDAMVNALTRLVEKEKPSETRIVRVHGLYWIRLWKRAEGGGPGGASSTEGFEDVICSLTEFQ
jgi:hypothetical protein